MDARFIGITAALGSAVSWALGSILFKQLGERISSPAMTWAKGVISLLLLAIALAIVGFEKMEWWPLWLLVWSGLLGIALGDTFFFEALQGLGPHAVVLLLMLSQVLTVVLAVVFLGETLTPTTWTGIVLVVGGVGIVLYAKLSGEQGLWRWRGIMFGLLSVLCMSVSIIIAKPALASISALQATFIRMGSGTAGMLLLGAGAGQLRGWIQPFEDKVLARRFVIAVCVITFGGFWLSLVAIKYVDVAVANTLISTEPLFILPLAAIILKERITLPALIGTASTIPGIFLLCIS
ncbi:MAG: DMT family transporter [Candidatus Competibacteraceae bacterium]